MNRPALYLNPVVLVKILCSIIALAGISTSNAGAQLFREQGDQSLEAAVMEADIILDAVQVSLEGASIINIIYGHNVPGFNFAPGMRVRLDEMPSLAMPTLATRDKGSAIVEAAISEKVLANTNVRMLLFRQPERELSMTRWGARPQQRLLPLTLDMPLPPRAYLGDVALSWFALLSRDTDKRQVGDHKWFVKTMIEDVEGTMPLEERRVFENLRAFFGLRVATKDFTPRFYSTPADLLTWDRILERIKRAISIKAKFDEMADSNDADQQWSFYVEQLKEENLYSNYALRELAGMGSEAVAGKLLAERGELRFFVDDVWETALRMVLNDPYFKVADRLEQAAEAISAIPESICSIASERAKYFANLLKQQGDPHLDRSVGLSDSAKFLRAFVRIYETELRCHLVERQLNRDTLVPKEPTRESALQLPENRGFTVDEIGLVGSVQRLTAEDYRKAQASLNLLEFSLSSDLLKSIRATPTGVRALLRNCAEGLEQYQDVALPDMTRGRSYLWQRSCEVMDDFEWPEAYCDPPDSGIGRDTTDINLVLAKSVLVAIEHDDATLLTNALQKLVRPPSLERAQIAAMLISSTKQYANKPLRQSLLGEMVTLPYFPVAKALAEEMAKAGSEQAKRIARTLHQITGAEGIDRSQAKSWIFYLNEIYEKRKGAVSRPLVTGPEVGELLNKKPCSEIEYGWNRLFRNQQL